jgi:citrate lyase subunit beta / citryl-CoA lyase
MLMTPGDDARLLAKQAASAADVALIDLEDSVHPTQREAARETAVRALGELPWGRKERVVRTSQWEAGGREDIEAVLPGAPDGVMLSKVARAREAEEAARLIERLQPGGRTRLWCMVESARSLLELDRIVDVPRMGGLMMGTGDLSLDLGLKSLGLRAGRHVAEVAELGLDLLYARSRVVAAARAAGLAAIDVSIVALTDVAAVERKARVSFQLGFDGKMVITPSHIPAIHRAYGPSPEDVEWAERVVAAFARMDEGGSGSAEVDGEPVDGPYLPYALRLLELAAAVRVIEAG